MKSGQSGHFHGVFMVNNATFETLLEQIRAGLSVTDACACAGIGRSTFYGWLKTVPARVVQIERAQVESKRRMIERVIAGAEVDVRWAAWWLERRYPREYGKPPLQYMVRAEEAIYSDSAELKRVGGNEI
jgi:hypothetical protein